MISVGLGPLEKELLGSFWGRRSFLKTTLSTAKPVHSHPMTLQGTESLLVPVPEAVTLPGPPCLQDEVLPFPFSGSTVKCSPHPNPHTMLCPTLVLLPLAYFSSHGSSFFTGFVSSSASSRELVLSCQRKLWP